jgi:zinc protease
MRNIVALMVLGLALASAGRASASDRDDALEILGKAIKAHGGEEALAKAAQLSRKGSGTIILFMEKEMPFTDDLTVGLPGRFRLAVDIMVEKQKMRIMLVVNGDTAWQDNGGRVEETSKERLAELQEEAYVQWMSLLMPLKKNTDFQLTPLPPAKIGGRPASGIKVERKPFPAIELYFDDDTKLLVKMQRKTKQGGIDVRKESYFSEFKEVEGVRLPFHIVETLNDKKFSDLKVDSYKLLEKADDKLFGKP